MKVVFRVDASSIIGIGHWIRCRTLANELARRGVNAFFVSRPLPGFDHKSNADGRQVIFLPDEVNPDTHLHAKNGVGCLGVDLVRDAEQTARVLGDLGEIDWLVNDNYAFDATWHTILRPSVRHILSIDDLANRPHNCDVLLDQNLRADGGAAYYSLIKGDAVVLAGPKYTLLRRQFSASRADREPHDGSISRIFLSFGGGADEMDITIRALQGLAQLSQHRLNIDVVIGQSYMHEIRLKVLANSMNTVRVFKNVTNMAKIMRDAHLALGAGGSATWERCCLGIPSIIVTTAKNQMQLNKNLNDLGVATHIGSADNVHPDDWAEAINQAILNPERLIKQSCAAAELVDGLGASRVVDIMLEISDA